MSADRLAPAADFGALLDEHIAVARRLSDLAEPAAKLAAAAISVLASGGKLLVCGNGGSAADSQHFATELTIRFEAERRALPAVALTTDSSALTAGGNDFGFVEIFARQVEALGREGDMLLGITTSGTSPNVLAALGTARRQGLVTACLTGRDGGAVAAEGLADHCLTVPDRSTARIQEMHVFLLHFLCARIDEAFAGRP